MDDFLDLRYFVMAGFELCIGWMGVRITDNNDRPLYLAVDWVEHGHGGGALVLDHGRSKD